MGMSDVSDVLLDHRRARLAALDLAIRGDRTERSGDLHVGKSFQGANPSTFLGPQGGDSSAFSRHFSTRSPFWQSIGSLPKKRRLRARHMSVALQPQIFAAMAYGGLLAAVF